MELILGLIGSEVTTYVLGSVGAVILAWILKKIPNNEIKKVVGTVMFNLGRYGTLKLSQWKYTAKFWNKIIEPWIIDFIDNVIGEGVREFIRGLRSD